MLKQKIERLMTDFGVKQEKIIEVLGTNRVTFGKKIKDNSFTPDECHRLNAKFGKLFN